MLASFFVWGVSLSHPALASLFFFREFLLHIPCWFHFLFGEFLFADFIFIRGSFFFYFGSFSYTSRTILIFIWGVSLTHPVLASFLSGEFLLHIPCCLHFYAGSFSYTSRVVFIFIRGVSLSHPVLASFFSGEFLLHIP